MTDPVRTWRARRAWGRFVGAVYAGGAEREWIFRVAGRVLWGTDTRLLRRGIGELARLPSDVLILDAPCGSGVALAGLRAAGGPGYVGVDISPAMVSRARRRAGPGSAARFARADVRALPFADGVFGGCLSYNGLHCLPDPGVAVAELARCLAPGGRLVGCCIVRKAGPRFDRMIALLRRFGVFGAVGTASDVRGWFQEAGLRLDRFDRSGAVVHFVAVRR